MLLLSFFIHNPQLILSSSIEMSAASLIGVIAYFLVYAVYMHQRIQKMQLHQQQLENEQKWHKIRAYKLSRYLPPTVWQAINRGDDKHLQAERKRISIFFSDIKGCGKCYIAFFVSITRPFRFLRIQFVIFAVIPSPGGGNRSAIAAPEHVSQASRRLFGESRPARNR